MWRSIGARRGCGTNGEGCWPITDDALFAIFSRLGESGPGTFIIALGAEFWAEVQNVMDRIAQLAPLCSGTQLPEMARGKDGRMCRIRRDLFGYGLDRERYGKGATQDQVHKPMMGIAL